MPSAMGSHQGDEQIFCGRQRGVKRRRTVFSRSLAARLEGETRNMNELDEWTASMVG